MVRIRAYRHSTRRAYPRPRRRLCFSVPQARAQHHVHGDLLPLESGFPALSLSPTRTAPFARLFSASSQDHHLPSPPLLVLMLPCTKRTRSPNGHVPTIMPACDAPPPRPNSSSTPPLRPLSPLALCVRSARSSGTASARSNSSFGGSRCAERLEQTRTTPTHST